VLALSPVTHWGDRATVRAPPPRVNFDREW